MVPRNAKKPAVWLPTIRANSGSDVFTTRLQKALERRGIRAEITWLPLRAEYAPWIVKVPAMPRWANIVHVNSWLPIRFVPSQVPVIATVHLCVHDRSLEPHKSRLQSMYHRYWVRNVENETLGRAEIVTAVSRYTAALTGQLLSHTGIVVIPNGVDTRIFAPDERIQPNKPFRLLYVGNWSTRKAVELLAPIMQQLGNDYELLYTEDRSRKHENSKLPNNCRPIGRPQSSSAMANWYRHADALLFPSRLEGFGLVAAESMACGTPVIASDNSALPEVIDDQTNGFLCKTDDVAGFVRSARLLKNDENLWHFMSKNAVSKAKLTFSEERQIDHYMQLYETALNLERYS